MKTITVDKLDMIRISNGSHNCIAVFKAVLNNCIRITGVKLFYDKLTENWWLKFPVNESNRKRLPYFSFVNQDDYHELLNAAIDKYLVETEDEETARLD